MAATTPPSIEECIANELGFLTEQQVLKLGQLKPSTTKAWAKRHAGPPYVIFGNNKLYPRRPFLEFLEKKMRAASSVSAQQLL